jgi:GNAT superfamily N-acetyltransferase
VLTVRNVPAEELPAVAPMMDGVMQRAYGVASFAAQLQWYIAVQPDAVVVAELDGVVVGTGCGIGYADGGFGWVGVIATEPGYERRGIGGLVTERVAEILADHGCAPVLDASLSGGPLYERMGFVDHGPTTVVSREPSPGGHALPGIAPADLADVAVFDRAAFGADRTRLLDVLVRSHPGRTAIVRGEDGRVMGFAIAQAGVIGPLAAADDETMERLVTAAAGLAWTRAPQICVPPESRHLETLHRLGWRTTRELRHMRRGIEVLPGRGDLYAGRVSLGIG